MFKASRHPWIAILAAFLLLQASACQLSGSANATGKTLCVDPDLASCYDTIGGAIGQASDGDTIQISADVYEEILNIEKSVTLRGTKEGSDPGIRTVIRSTGIDAPILQTGLGKLVKLYTLEITGGHFSSVGGGGIVNHGGLFMKDVIVDHNSTSGYGGGILNLGDLHMEDSLVQYNTANGPNPAVGKEGRGGGIYNHQGMVVLTGTDVLDNSTNGQGGGLYTNGDLTMTDCNVSRNEARVGGGGLAVRPWEDDMADIPDVQLERVTIDNNHTSGHGGGIYVVSSAMALTNVTLSGNVSEGLGGGMSFGADFDAPANSGTVTIVSSTIANNRSLDGGGIADAEGGAVTFTVLSTIFADNEGGNCRIWNSQTTFLSHDYNISDDDTCDLPFHADLMNTDPRLFSLQMNAPGRVKTQALKYGSPADNINTAGCVAVDARGAARGLPCDAGAYEGTLEPLHPSVAVIAKNATCRSGPGTDYAAMGYLNSGESHTISGRNVDGTWLKLETCWVAAGLLETEGDLQLLPVLEVPPPPEPTSTSTVQPQASCSSWTSPEACRAAGCTWEFSAAGPGFCK